MRLSTRACLRATFLVAVLVPPACGSDQGGSSGTGGGGGSVSSTGGSSSATGGHGTGGTNTGGAGAVGSGGIGTGGSATGGSIGTGGKATGGSTGTGGGATGGSTGTGGNGTGGSATGGSTGHGGGGGATGTGGGPAGANGHGGSGGGTGSGGVAGTTGGGTGGGSPVTCASTVLKAGDSTKKITVGTLSREYILHVPSGYTGTTPVPFVVDFHPIGGSDTSWRSGSPYPAVIDKEGVVSAFPNGEPSPNLGNAWNVEGCCTSPINGVAVDDVAFAKALVTDVEKVVCVDVKRVYAVGFSMGGGMSNYLGCHGGDVFAAAGPASFDLTQQNVGDCTPLRPITMIEWRGKNDTTVPYAGGHSALVTGMALDFLGAVGTFQKWASLDGCTGNPSAADSNNCQTYSQCSAGVQVTLCTDNNGGHEAANAGIVWPMLKKYTLP
jgi:polyhydroxybutyrate depolymerase